jgi:rhomboid protease GluP
VLLRFGAMFGPLIATGEYWRLFTAMFLHVGVTHLAVNSIGLFILGVHVERLFGHYRFAAIYLLAGLSGSVASFAFNSVGIAAGASGAIFGVLGALVAFFVVRRNMMGEMGRQTLTGLLVLLAINLFFGFASPGIDNFAHLGGFIAGFALGIAFAPQYRPVSDISGIIERMRDANSLLRRWWVLPLSAALLVLGTVLAGAANSGNPVTQSITHLREAERLLEDGQHSSALDEVGQAIENDPFNGESYLVRAKVWASLGDSQRAISDAGRAIQFGLDEGGRQEAVALMIRLRSGVR